MALSTGIDIFVSFAYVISVYLSITSLFVAKVKRFIALVILFQ